MKFKAKKKIENPIQNIQRVRHYPRTIRRNLWRHIQESEALSWREYREIENLQPSAISSLIKKTKDTLTNRKEPTL